MGLFFGKTKKKVVAIFDIGSGSVGGALVELGGVEKPRVIFSTREDISFQNNFKFERFFKSMLDSFDVVLGRIVEKNKNIEDVICVLSAPWYISQTIAISHDSKKLFTVTQKIIDDLIEDAVKKMKLDFDKKRSGVITGSVEVMEIKNTHVKLNGYETSAPLEKQVNKFEASLYVSMSSSKVLRAIREKIKTRQKIKNILFHSFSLISFSTIRDIHSDIRDFMVLDISGEATDITIVRQDTLVETFSFPFGKHLILRTIASKLGVSLEEAYSTLSLFMEKKAVKEVEVKMSKILSYCEEKWLGMFGDGLDFISKYTVLPTRVFLITDKPLSGWFAKTIKKFNFNNSLFLGDEFRVDILQANVLAKFGNFDINVPRDSFIITEALFANKILGNEK